MKELLGYVWLKILNNMQTKYCLYTVIKAEHIKLIQSSYKFYFIYATIYHIHYFKYFRYLNSLTVINQFFGWEYIVLRNKRDWIKVSLENRKKIRFEELDALLSIYLAFILKLKALQEISWPIFKLIKWWQVFYSNKMSLKWSQK